MKDKVTIPDIVVFSWLDADGKALPCEVSFAIATKPVPPFGIGRLPPHHPLMFGVSTAIPEEPLDSVRSAAVDEMLRSKEYHDYALIWINTRLLMRPRKRVPTVYMLGKP